MYVWRMIHSFIYLFLYICIVGTSYTLLQKGAQLLHAKVKNVDRRFGIFLDRIAWLIHLFDLDIDFDLSTSDLSSIYSRVPLMWTPKGRVKSVHISEPSTVVDTLCCGHINMII